MKPCLPQVAKHRTIHPPDVIVGPSPGRGRGVFAKRGFEPNETIEVCPVVVLSEADARSLDDTKLNEYYFGWGHDGKQAGIVLGYGSIYNHSFTANAVHHKDAADGTMSVHAVRKIAPGEEIFIHYDTGKDAERQTMWFEVR